MNYIICKNTQSAFFAKLIALIGTDKNNFEFITDNEQLENLFSSNKVAPNFILVDSLLGWGDDYLQNASGFEIAAKLRRDYLIKCPIIFFSSLRKSFFDKQILSGNKFSLINAKGSGFLSFPFTLKAFNKLLSEIKSLDDRGLREVVINQCRLKQHWQKTSHKIGNLLSDYPNNYEEIRQIAYEWAESINYFAPDKVNLFEKFQKQLIESVNSENTNNLKLSLQTLDESLKGKKPYDFSEIDIENLPKFPPKDYSKILIADDEPLDSLVNGLQNEYRYTIVGQAQGANEAGRLLKDKKPDVVLSDFYFKEYARDKTTDKKFGGQFMVAATDFEIGSPNKSKKPIVAVISKTSLDKQEIPQGVLDFSGSLNATNPEFVHRGIWLEAIRRGITEPEAVENQNWTLEYQCRQRLESYKKDLPKLIWQWDFFKDTVQETIDMIGSLPVSDNAEDLSLIKSIKKTLKPFEKVKDFSLKEVSEIFSKVEEDHKKAKQPPESNVKTQIRNILHGKIEQFSRVTNYINFTLKVFTDVSSDLISLPEYQQIGIEFRNKLDTFRDDKPLLPFLNVLQETVDKILERLPEIPKIKNPVKAKSSISRKIHFLIAEDDLFWGQTVVSTIEKVKQKLGSNFQITYKYFRAVRKAINAVPEISSTPTKKEAEQKVEYIAVVDICLPLRIMRGEIPTPENGIKLIKALSKYTSNVPLIVFSTKASLVDRQVIGRLGIPDGHFIAKDYDAEHALTEALISLIEKKDKYIIRRVPYKKNGALFYDFLINGLQIPFTTELNITFEALYSLKVDKKYENQNLFSIKEINKKRLLIKKTLNTEEEIDENQENSVQDHIYRIRELVHEIFQRNNRYINTRELIKTTSDGEEFFYELNADLPLSKESNLPLEDEEIDWEKIAWEEIDWKKIDEKIDSEDEDELIWKDYQNFKNKKFNVLVIGDNADISTQITDILERKSENVFNCSPAEEIEELAETFCPDIVCTELENIEIWNRVRPILHNKPLGIIVTTTNEEENRLVQKAIKSGVPVANFVSINEPDWINSFLTKLNNEKQRVFLGKVDDSLNFTKEPIVEVLKGSNLLEGKLQLQVNNKLFAPNRSNQSKILSYLLQNPGTLISLDTIKKDVLGLKRPVADNYLNKLVERIRTQIQENWLNTDERELAMQILESSAKGMQLNVQVIYPQAIQ